jgi:O-antigen ligase
VRSREDLLRARNALMVGIVIVGFANFVAVAFYSIGRAGGVWVFGEPGIRSAASWSIGDLGLYATNPNELAAGCLLAWAILCGLPYRRWLTVVLLGITFWLLLASLSRSGLLAWGAFVMVYGWYAKQRWLWFVPVLLAGVIPFLPDEIKERIIRTAVQERGSFEAYTSIIRFYSWEASLAVFLANPILGVGYLGFRFVSQQYNPLGIVLVTSESFYLETASGMGILGVATLAAISWAILHAARIARHSSPKESLAHRLGTVAPAYLLGIGVGNLTGNNLIGLMGVSQLAVFAGFLCQAMRFEAAAPTRPVAESAESRPGDA